MVKELEGEVLAALLDLGDIEYLHDENKPTVGPFQFRGIELNQHAADIAELVLWLAYLQNHYKVNGRVPPSEPIIPEEPLIERRDAILAYDITRETPFANPRPAAPWPKADFVVGNPPFIGSKRMREYLGDGHVNALFKSYPDFPKNTDYVMYFWDRAATLAREKRIVRFGLISTNSIGQVSNSQVISMHLNADSPLSLIFAIPDHPWIDSSGSAKVRIAMTGGEAGQKDGVLATVINTESVDGIAKVELATRHGRINPDLTIGPDLTKATPLKANRNIAYAGMAFVGEGFSISDEKAAELGLGTSPGLEQYIRPFRSGNDITGISRDRWVIDFYGLDIEEVSQRFPSVHRHLLDEVKPVRDQNNRKNYRKYWWVLGEPRPGLRKALDGLDRYIATTITTKHRPFVFFDNTIISDSGVAAIALDDAYHLGVLSSRIHDVWSRATGGSLGTALRYNKSVVFDVFPFPDADSVAKSKIRDIAARIDQHRKERQAQYPKLTLTSMYNVLEQLREGDELASKDMVIREQGDVDTLLALHDDLDATVAEAYGWPGDLSDDEIIQVLFDLNQHRAEEEAAGQIRWLRQDWQNN